MKKETVIAKVWRSELKLLSAFVFFSILSVLAFSEFHGNRLLFPTAPLFTIGSTTIYARLPLLWFVPFLTLGFAAYRIYDVRYSIDGQGIEARVGILSLKQSITRVRYEDIRSIETEQTLLDRLLDTGTVEISTAATGQVEIRLAGISAPEEVQNMLQRERDSRQKAARDKIFQMYDESANV